MKNLFAFAIAAVLVGCSPTEKEGTTSTTTAPADKPLVVFSQANSQDPWRKVFDAEIKAAAERYASEFSFEMQDAADDSGKQNNIIDTFMIKKPKVLIVSPCNTAVQPSIEKAFDAGTAVLVLDRSLENSKKYTAHIGGDNVAIARMAGEYVAKQLGGKGTVLMIQGIATTVAAKERRDGFMEVMKKNPGIHVIEGDDCGFQRQKARAYMETVLQKDQVIDCVYGHNDEMAIGARLAWDAGRPATAKAPLFVGVDACQQEVIDLIKAGKMSATIQYITPGAKAIELAAEILKGNSPKEKKVVLPAVLVTKENADEFVKDNPNLAK